ncbi:diguanylate cyclase domain-containing protein [Mesoterricola silvestris]|uniref:diguanylate cyclase n=1 Tax=Mesoterricola silvestris TaxID=2927979 RepID=A0AA48KAD5_9BACT|nr:diguanylate cyclase [Mesoterricola silvestris]BDU71408.1 hypothetical protein METEAL_05820 [Mesoterricola silvestris]
MTNPNPEEEIHPPDPGGPLEGPVVAAFLKATGCHALLLDRDMRVLSFSPGAPGALGLDPGPGGIDILPLLVRDGDGLPDFLPCGPPLPIGGGRHLWVYRDARGRERSEGLEMARLGEVLSALTHRPPGTRHAPELWEKALALYREVGVPGMDFEPPREVPGARAQEGEALPAGPDPGPAPGQAPTVLVVDDSPVIRRLLAAILGREFRVTAAGDGETALALARAAQPDLILLDAVMPGLDGFGVCARLKADGRTGEIPVLFLTALQGERDEIRALEAGAIDFIHKPINGATVLARVRNHVELKRSKDRLQELAVQDSLTSLSNRRQFDGVLAREWQRCRREGCALALIMGDVDCFKNYNDTYGHVAGDACLRAVAGTFAAALRRPADLAARYGGEEFVCLLPDTDEEGARAVADQITAALADLALPHARSDVSTRVTVSLGVAALWPSRGGLPGSLVEAADRRMYAAKHGAKERHLRA